LIFTKTAEAGMSLSHSFLPSPLEQVIKNRKTCYFFLLFSPETSTKILIQGVPSLSPEEMSVSISADTGI
jgi:hypothetical protein